MAKNLSSLVHELRERIAASSSTPPSNKTVQDDDALESRFRAVLPNLLHTYVVPSSANDREVTAILKLLTYTAKNIPGVFFHGNPAAVLPVICRILPFFAEPSFCSRHGVIFETVGSLLSLLRTGDRDMFRQFFMDTMLLIEDLLYVASKYNLANHLDPEKVSLKCFSGSLSGISGTALLGDIPACSKPASGYGILINLTGISRWQPFTTWTIKLLSKCLTEGTLYVEGLINTKCVVATCTLLCYGNADLQMACFDFTRDIVAVLSSEMIPHEKMIQSISTILSEHGEKHWVFRDATYDSSLGECLYALHSACPDDVVMLTAADLVNVFADSMQKTRSIELKAALCSAYIRIAKSCGPHIWRPETLFNTIGSSKPCLPLIECFRVSLSTLVPDLFKEITKKNYSLDQSHSEKNEFEPMRVGEKRPGHGTVALKAKRHKKDDLFVECTSDFQLTCKLDSTSEHKKEYADYLHSSLLLFLERLQPPDDKVSSFTPDVALMALSTLCIVFCGYVRTDFSRCILGQMRSWIFWVCVQARQGVPVNLDLSFFLEAIHSVLHTEQFFSMEDRLFQNENSAEEFSLCVLKLPWNSSFGFIEPQVQWKAKCLSLQVVSKMVSLSRSGSSLELLDMGLLDESEVVRREAIISMLMIAFWSGSVMLSPLLERIRYLKREHGEQIKKIIPHYLGYMACLCGSCPGFGLCESECKLFLKRNDETTNWSIDHLKRAFWCSKCDLSVPNSIGLYSLDMHHRALFSSTCETQ